MALAKKRKATLLVAKLDRLSRSVAFIATLMDSKGFDLAIADMPGGQPADPSRARPRCRAPAPHDRRAHTPCTCRREGTGRQARQSGAGQDQSANAAERARALRPHIERCIKAGRTSSSAIATDLNARGIAGTEWRPMVSDADSSRPPSSRPVMTRGVVFGRRELFSTGPELGERPHGRWR